MGGIIDSSSDSTLVVSDIEVSELRIKVVDCRTNKVLKNFQTSKVKISNGIQTIEREFNRLKDVQNIDETDKIKGSLLALQKLGYETADKETAADKLPKNYDETWRGYYNSYWSDRIPDFEELAEGNPSESMMTYIIKEYNNHRTTDANGLLRIQIPNKLLDNKEVTIEVGFFNFPVVLEKVNNDSRSNTVLRNSDSEDSETGFAIKWNSGNNQDKSWKGNFGWKIHKGTTTSEFKFSEEFKIKSDTSKFEKFNSDSCSQFYDENVIDSPHYFLFALQWCQPIYDFVDDPDCDPKRSNDDTFVNMKHGTGEDEKWIRGLNLHMPSNVNTGAYYGRRATTGETIMPRGGTHNGIDLYSGPTGNYPVFAVHAGKITKKNSTTYGHAGGLALQGTGHPSFYYAHLGEEVEEKDWVMAGQIIGISNITKSASDSGINSYYSPYPYHLHFEFFKKAPGGNGVPGTASTHPRDKIEEFPGMAAPTGAKYNIPDKKDANAFMFLAMNNLPIIFPCKSLSRRSDKALKTGEKDADFQYNHKCKVKKEGDTGAICYAISEFPYTNNRLKSTLNLSSHDLHPTSGLIRYVCPYILNSPNKKLQLQAKVKWLIVNRSRFTPSIFSYADTEEATFNSFFSDSISGLTIDGGLGTVTKKFIRSLIRAYFYCNNTELEADERILKTDNAKITDSIIDAFANKYVSDTAISDDDDYSIIRDFNTWFSGLDFSKISWNA